MRCRCCYILLYMYMRIKRISRCQKRCSDGKPFYYIAHSDINNTLGNFLFKDKILQLRFLKNSNHWTYAKSLFYFPNQFLAFQSAFLCSTTALLTTRTILNIFTYFTNHGGIKEKPLKTRCDLFMMNTP